MDEQEEKLLRSVALQNAQSVLSARQRAEQELIKAKEALEDEKRVLELLNRTAALLVSKLDFEGLVQAVTDAATELSGAQFGAFFYTNKDEQGGSFLLYSLSGAPREAFAKFGHPRATPLFGPTFKGEGVVRIGNVLTDPRYGQMAPHHGMPKGHLPVCSYLAVPVISRSGEVIGGLFFGHSKPDVFTERAEKIVVGVAAQAAIAIDNARLYDQAKRSAEERAHLLSAERAARSEVERVSLIKDEFLATLSHELRTPMNAVLGWAEILLARSKEDSDQRRGLETIARNARAQARLIEDLLDMNRIVSGKIRLDVQRMDLLQVVEAAVESARPSAESKGIRIRTVLDPQAGPISGDPNRIQQVVWNLLTNAVKFSPKDGAVDVLLERVDSHIEITVTDKGVGIATEFLPHVFERFRQADATTTRRFGGLGLGLSIVKQLVELHGGSVRAQSPGLDKGATFIVSLPLAVVRDQAGREHPATSKGPAVAALATVLEGVSVLLVDDEPDAREMLRVVLNDAKATTAVASSAAEALALLRTRRFDVIVSDIGMPEKDGYELIREVRQMPEADGGKTPAIAVTAFARSEDRTRAMRSGYQVHIAKPIEPQELLATIGSLLGRAPIH